MKRSRTELHMDPLERKKMFEEFGIELPEGEPGYEGKPGEPLSEAIAEIIQNKVERFERMMTDYNFYVETMMNTHDDTVTGINGVIKRIEELGGVEGDSLNWKRILKVCDNIKKIIEVSSEDESMRPIIDIVTALSVSLKNYDVCLGLSTATSRFMSISAIEKVVKCKECPTYDECDKLEKK